MSKTGDELKPLQGHNEAVLSAAFSPTENLLATGSKDKSARLWNLDTGTVRVLTTEANSITEVLFSRDGTRLLTKNADGQLKVWDVKTGAVVGTLASSFLSGVASLSPDGEFLGVVDQHSIVVLNLGTAKRTELKLTNLASSTIGYDPHSAFLAVGEGSNPTVWDLKTGSLKSRFGRHLRRLRSLGVSPDGAELAAADPLLVMLWNVNSGETKTLSSDAKIPGRSILVLSPDHKVLAIHADSSLTERTTTLWAIDEGRKLISISDTAGAPIVFSSTSRYFADIDPSGLVKILDLSGKDILKIPQVRDLSPLAFSPDDSLVAALARQNEIRVWNLPGGVGRGR